MSITSGIFGDANSAYISTIYLYSTISWEKVWFSFSPISVQLLRRNFFIFLAKFVDPFPKRVFYSTAASGSVQPRRNFLIFL